MKKILLLSCVLFVFACKEEVKNVEENIETSVCLTIDSTEIKRLAEIENLILNNPNSFQGYLERATYYRENQQFEDAFNDIEKAMRIKPSNPDVNLEKGLIYISMNKLELGIPFLENTIKLDSMHTEGNLELAYYYLTAKNYESSFALINKIIKKDQYLAKPYYLKGMWYENTGKIDLAISSYQTAVERNPKYYNAYLALGALYDRMDNPLAIQYFNSAIVLWPNSIEAWRAKGMSYREHNEFEKAIVCFDTILYFDSTFEVSYFDIGKTLMDLCYEDNPKSKNDSLIVEAIKRYDKALEINFNYIPARFNRALCYEEQGKLELAIEEYKKVLELEPNYELAVEAMNRLGK